MGLIAQEDYDNIHYGPAYVSKDDPTPEDPDPLMSLDYSNFVPDLIAAVKQLSTRINELESERKMKIMLRDTVDTATGVTGLHCRCGSRWVPVAWQGIIAVLGGLMPLLTLYNKF